MRSLPLAAALILAAAPACAHKLKVFAAAEGDAIVGTAYFAGGAPAQGSAGRVLGPDGAEIAQFRTDEAGGFRIAVSQRQDYRVSVDSGDGHLAEARIGAAELGGTPPPGATAAPAAALADPVEAAVARQVLPLRRQIDAMEERARFSDIMGGIGTIFGLFGVFAWVAARRRSRPCQSTHE